MKAIEFIPGADDTLGIASPGRAQAWIVKGCQEYVLDCTMTSFIEVNILWQFN